VRCGREFKQEQLIQGYCVECFKEYIGVFEYKPALKIVICPKCLSWLFRGEWLTPGDLEEIVKTTSLSELNKCIRSSLQLNDLSVLGINQERDKIRVKLKLSLKTETVTFTTVEEVTGNVKYRVCPRCIAKSSGKYTHLIQIRFTRKNPPSYVLEDLEKLLQKLLLQSGVINVKYYESGIDLELDDATIARRIVQSITREFSAKSTTSFKATKFDYKKGSWRGVLTYSLRIPIFERGEVVIYKETLHIVEDLKKNKVVLFNPNSGTREEVSLSSYWTGELKSPSRVEVEHYIVKDIRGDKIIAVSENSKSELVIKKKQSTPQVKIGDTILLIKANNIESIVIDKSSLLR